MSEMIKELRNMTMSALISKHDELAQSTVVGTNHYLAEITRRDQEKQTRSMSRMTLCITIMTIIMTISTILNTLYIIKIMN